MISIRTNTPILKAYVTFEDWPNVELLRSVHLDIATFWNVPITSVRPERLDANHWKYTSLVGSKELQSYAKLGEEWITVELG